MFYIRKIDKGKWKPDEITINSKIPADAITNCLNTKNNELSTWKGNSNYESLLSLLSTYQHLDKVDFIMISTAELNSLNIVAKSSPGKNPVQTFVNNHFDLEQLTLQEIDNLANLIKNKFLNKKVFRLTAPRVKRLLKKAIAKGLIKKEQLHPDLNSKL